MARKTPVRESVTTIKEDGSRLFLHPADVSGVFTKYRRWFGYALILFYAGLPWIHIGGYPAVFFDIANRQFHVLGATFTPHDSWLLFFFITGLGFALFFISAVLGRIWCGWACPQTVFLEHVYRRIERWIDGNATARRQLDRKKMNGSKLLKRVIKHSLYILISGIIAHIFLSYFVSIEQLSAWIRLGPGEHPKTFGFILVFSAILYGNFFWFREQLCLVICPYGRLQSALVDDDSMIIGYDEKRGEPRGTLRDKSSEIGDCISCNRCVEVCPTGIDIRHGLQLECIGCANCIDACNEIMERNNRPKNLIRYDSLNGLAGKTRKIFRPRFFLYLAFLLLGCGVLAFTLTTLQPVSVNTTRLVGAPYFITEGMVRNQFQVKLNNKRHEPITLRKKVISDNPKVIINNPEEVFTIPALEKSTLTVVASIANTDYQGEVEVTIQILKEDGSIIKEEHMNFLGPR